MEVIADELGPVWGGALCALAAAGLLIAGHLLLEARARRRRRRRAWHCLRCGYPTQGMPPEGLRCAECGLNRFAHLAKGIPKP